KAAAPSGRAPGSPVGLWGRGGEQARLKASVVEEDTEEWQKDPDFSGLQRVGGVDLSYVKGDESRACASLVVLSFPALEGLWQQSVCYVCCPRCCTRIAAWWPSLPRTWPDSWPSERCLSWWRLCRDFSRRSPSSSLRWGVFSLS
uniref:Endonuclease V n=1 Tax=Catharus ustulatus TaxID=91951 RepID=A0A8C3UEJ0_CATUS